MNIETWKKRFLDAIELVEASYDVQIDKFGKNFPIADEIALNFNDEIFEQIDFLLENGVINQSQFKYLHELNTQFTKMSQDKKQDLWSLDALKSSDEWNECRQIARLILKADK